MNIEQGMLNVERYFNIQHSLFDIHYSKKEPRLSAGLSLIIF